MFIQTAASVSPAYMTPSKSSKIQAVVGPPFSTFHFPCFTLASPHDGKTLSAHPVRSGDASARPACVRAGASVGELDSLPGPRGRAGSRPWSRSRGLPRTPDQRCGTDVCRQLGCLAPDTPGTPVPRARRPVHLPRAIEPPDLGGEGSRNAATRRDQELHQYL